MSYKSFSSKELKSITERYTDGIVKETETGILLFIQQGARLLGMYPGSEGDNVLWVNADLETNLEEHQPLVGGESLEISPERNFYYENPRDFEGYRIPFEIDPGEYKLIDDSVAVIFKSTFSLLEYDRNKLFDNSHEKREFKVIQDPYNTNLPYAGVSITDTVSINAKDIEMCACSLAQVYTYGPTAPGTAFFPVKSDCKLLSYFDPIPPDRVKIFQNYARFKIDADKNLKLAIRPEDMCFDNPCKIVYLSPSPSNKSVWSCLIKRCNDMPKSQAECVDMSRSNPDGPKGAIQAFNHGPVSIGERAFPIGELELQLSKGVIKGKNTVSKGIHELLGYTGSKDEMLELAKTALQLKMAPMLY